MQLPLIICAGGQHACFIAKGLGIGLVVVPQFSSVLSAYGIACADVTVESAGPFFVNLSTSEANDIRVKVENRVFELQEDVCHKLAEQDVRDGDTDYEITVGCSYDRSDTVLQIPFSRSIKADFIAEHLRETSFSMPRDVLINSIRVRGTGRRYNYAANGFADGLAALESSLKKTEDIPSCYQNAYFESEMGGRRVQTPVFTLSDTLCGSEIPGPAIIADKTQAIVVEPDCVAKVLSQHVVIRIGTNQTSNKNNINEAPLVADPIMLAVFGNRFMSIAEQMGHTLQRTSISVSIKASVFVIFNTLVEWPISRNDSTSAAPFTALMDPW